MCGIPGSTRWTPVTPPRALPKDGRSRCPELIRPIGPYHPDRAGWQGATISARFRCVTSNLMGAPVLRGDPGHDVAVLHFCANGSILREHLPTAIQIPDGCDIRGRPLSVGSARRTGAVTCCSERSHLRCASLPPPEPSLSRVRSCGPVRPWTLECNQPSWGRVPFLYPRLVTWHDPGGHGQDVLMNTAGYAFRNALWRCRRRSHRSGSLIGSAAARWH